MTKRKSTGRGHSEKRGKERTRSKFKQMRTVETIYSTFIHFCLSAIDLNDVLHILYIIKVVFVRKPN